MVKTNLTIQYQPYDGNGTLTLTASLGDEPIAVDNVAILEAAARDRFESLVCDDRPAIPRDGVRAELLAIAQEHRAKRSDGGQGVNSSNSFNSSPSTLNIESEWPSVMAPEAFHGPAGELVHMVDPHTEADPAAVLLQTLIGFGNMAGRSAHFVADASTHYVNEFCVLVGRSSKGRKGTSWNNVKLRLSGVDPEWVTNRIQGGLSSGEGLIWAVRDEVTKQVPVKTKGRFSGEYDTVIESPAVKDKRLLIQEGEFANVLRVSGRDGNTLSVVIRSAWDFGDLQSMTKNSPAKATGAHISIVGHITADELRKELDTTTAANGFGNRFLWCCVQRSKCLPEGGNLAGVDFFELDAQFALALANAHETTIITRDSAARELWAEVYPVLSEAGPGLAGSLTGRGESHVMRLACIYALLDQSRIVRVPHLRAALAVWDYCKASVEYVFGKSLGDPMADELLRVLRDNPNGMTRTEVSKYYGNNKEASQVGRALTLLADHGLARMAKDASGPGRPVERWFAITGSTKETKLTKEPPAPASPMEVKAESGQRRVEAVHIMAMERLGYDDVEIINMSTDEFWRIFDARQPKDQNSTDR